MIKVNAYPAILEKTRGGFSVFFPDLPGAVSAGRDYEDAVSNAKECLSLHLYGMIEDTEKLPKASHMNQVIKKIDMAAGDLIALVEPDILAVKSQQEAKSVRINITMPKSLLEALDERAQQLHINRSLLIQQAARDAL